MYIKPIKAGLLGLPLSSSLSPAIFRIFSSLSGCEIKYELRECGAAELASVIHTVKSEVWSGFNVTIPHKRAVFKMLDLPDPASRGIKAVNAVRFGRKGLEGLNTDAAGIVSALQENGISPAGKNAVIFGAGGSAAAAGWALGRARAASVTFCARNGGAALETAGNLAEVFPGTVFSAAPFAVPGSPAGIFVNATPLGMYAPGKPPANPKPGDVCLDLAYAPEGTEFIKTSALAGAITIDGLEVLVRQAALSLKFWAGLPGGDIVEFNREALRLLREKLQRGD
ncbi:MAG: hypothetical protein Q7R35_14085 [Elusimicrobiota bacterium]|nr:hypothetical protein [Elusimicrobiota bacterium]